MIKRASINRISRCTILIFVVFLFCLFPKKEKYELDEIVISEKMNYHDIFLLDKNGYLAKTKIPVISKNEEDLVDEIIEIITIDSKYQEKIPNGFTQILPVDTKLLDKKLLNGTLILNFNKELLEVKKEMEEKIIEGIIFNITSIKNMDRIEIKIEGNTLDRLPKSGVSIKNPLKRDFGINKEYNLDNLKDIMKVIVYYASKTNDDYIYYVPVTKYINSNNDKIKIIIDELTSKISYESNLMSYLNYNAKLLDYSFNKDELDLNFNEYLFDNDNNKKVLEEVIYSISYSIEDNYNVSKINFYVNNEEIK